MAENGLEVKPQIWRKKKKHPKIFQNRLDIIYRENKKCTTLNQSASRHSD